ncbi:hypothetical protein Pla100_34330 [Neorhodopirellula pilleata]|uniref:TraX protein n=2 Tax=Neorhodopirellula pilleata TaxID=2714738 RepID=A0A5C6A8R7_9BACT|nr:hypothetical protein Pla100_34330 [Neorhodopirellula pilleata]
MMIDHAAGLIGGWSISESSVRIAARLSMPLFAVLMGYFLRPGAAWIPEEGLHRSRLLQIGLAAVLVNLVFYPMYGCVDILCSLFLVAIIARLAGRAFPIFVVVALAYPIDPTDGWPTAGPMDFPLTIVLAFVALGNLYATAGRKAALIAAAALTLFYPLAASATPGSVSSLLFLFVFPACLLLAVAEQFPRLGVPGLETLGRHPLKAYVIQYYVIMAVAHGYH